GGATRDRLERYGCRFRSSGKANRGGRERRRHRRRLTANGLPGTYRQPISRQAKYKKESAGLAPWKDQPDAGRSAKCTPRLYYTRRLPFIGQRRPVRFLVTRSAALSLSIGRREVRL